MTTTYGIASSTSTGSSALSTSGAKFGDNPFLRLLTEQLRNQTPLEPVDNASFMQQMAQYSTMEEQRDLNKNMLSLLDYQGLLARMQGISEGSALLGKEVTFEGSEGREQTGTVRSVFIDQQGEIQLKLGDDRVIAMRQVTAISTPSTESGAA